MNELIEALIAAACVAGAYSAGLRDDPRLAGGWERKYAQWHDRTTRLADRVAGAALGDREQADEKRRPLPAPTPKRRD